VIPVDQCCLGAFFEFHKPPGCRIKQALLSATDDRAKADQGLRYDQDMRQEKPDEPLDDGRGSMLACLTTP
jgi:hypothetical protein